jgi:hypothetical protein
LVAWRCSSVYIASSSPNARATAGRASTRWWNLYQAGEPNPRGCYLTSTAITAALDSPAVRAGLLASHQAFDRLLAARFAAARDAGELPPDSDPELLGALAVGVIHTLAVRIRAREARRRLEQLADAAVAQLCGGAGPARAAPRRRKR